MDIFFQAWGGLFYLFNKMFFALAEGKDEYVKRKLKIYGWAIYILGVPAWVIILVGNHNWIAASIEIGGVPSMLLGLITVYHHNKRPTKALTHFATISVYIFLILGIGYSLYDYGGLTKITQVLEITAMGGFLLGSYLLAKNILNGWLFFILMNLSVALLMFIQNKYLLSAQQLLSLMFVIYGYFRAMKYRQR